MMQVTDALFRSAVDTMAAPPDTVGPDRIADLLGQHYGLKGQITLLASEIERTAAVDLPDGCRLILKTSTGTAAQESFAFQSATLATLSGMQGVVVPTVLPTNVGELVFHHEGMWGYLQTRLEGDALHRLDPSAALGHQSGAALGRLSRAMEDAAPPGARRPVLWNISYWPRLMQFARHLPQGPIGALVHAAMEDHVRSTLPLLADLPWQVTHNDPSPHNMMQTAQGIGFIDFGDGGYGPRLQDLAIAASHMVSDPARPLGGAEPLIAGYSSVLQLSDCESRVLVGMIRARQAAMILINHWRARLYPAEAAYITKNVARAERGLQILAPLDPAAAQAAVRAAARTGTPSDRLTA